ncbi:MAG: amino acid ABC transporter substrate-binding protein [Oscillospiraceae bacterium]|jgi:branched-chain amino acid transport system substrate-binding protein|nr:MAG: amino acid ABC transporter substrate-binding protein [Oscillospiraceae bacterium]
MKKIIALILTALMLVSVFAACGEKTDGDVVKIGIYEPASGSNGAGGKQEALGIKYANSVQPTVDIGGKTYKVELVSVDNQSSNDKAPSAAAELVSAGVSVVLGSYGSGVSIAAAPTFEQAGVPAIGITCTNPQVTEGNKHYFRICFLDPFQGTVLANYAYNELGYRTAYTLAENGNDYDEGLAHYFTEAFTKLGGKVENANFPENTSDFNSYITNAVNAGAEVIFAPTSTSYAQLIVEQAAAKGVSATIMAGDTWDSNQILSAAKGKKIDIQVTTFYQEGGNADFDKGFKAFLEGNEQNLTDNGGDSNIAAVSAMGYDAYFVALEALKAAGSTDRAKVTEALWKVSTTGVTGAIAFDDVNGDAIRTTAYIKKVNTTTGLWDFVKEQGVAK